MEEKPNEVALTGIINEGEVLKATADVDGVEAIVVFNDHLMLDDYERGLKNLFICKAAEPVLEDKPIIDKPKPIAYTPDPERVAKCVALAVEYGKLRGKVVEAPAKGMEIADTGGEG